MTPAGNSLSQASAGPEALPLSLLNGLLYCPRRAALQAIEGWRGANHLVNGLPSSLSFSRISHGWRALLLNRYSFGLRFLAGWSNLLSRETQRAAEPDR